MRTLVFATAALLATAAPLCNEVEADDYALASPNRRAHPLSEYYLVRAFQLRCELEFIEWPLRGLAEWAMREFLKAAE